LLLLGARLLLGVAGARLRALALLRLLLLAVALLRVLGLRRLRLVATDLGPGPVRERQLGRVVDVVAGRRRVAPERRQGPGGLARNPVAAVAVDAGLHADGGDQAGVARREADALEGGDRGLNGPAQLLVRRAEPLREVPIAGPERRVALRDLDPQIGVGDALDV